MTQPDYNDGKWHGWNGGECPVHPESVVEMVYTAPYSPDGPFDWEGRACRGKWGHDGDNRAIAFRVTTPYVELPKPLEVWVNVYDDGGFGDLYSSADVAVGNASDNCKYRTVKLREVIEE